MYSMQREHTRKELKPNINAEINKGDGEQKAIGKMAPIAICYSCL